MTKEELASQLDGAEYPLRISEDMRKLAKASGLVVVYGASDDLMEFDGAIHDEIGAYEGTTARLHRTDILQPHDDCDCEYCGYKVLAAKCAAIKAIWDQDGYAWVYETNIPHATFEILDGGGRYCRGIVLSVEDLPVVL